MSLQFRESCPRRSGCHCPLLPNATILTEANATESQPKQAQSPRILHIATHGVFKEDAPRPEPKDTRNLTFASTDGLRAFPRISAPVENPLLMQQGFDFCLLPSAFCLLLYGNDCSP